MSDAFTAEKVDIYGFFRETAEGLEIEFDAEELWLFDDCEQAVDDAVDDITETYNLGVLATSYREIVAIAAIAFCDAAESGELELKVFDYVEAGGEKYEDD